MSEESNSNVEDALSQPTSEDISNSVQRVSNEQDGGQEDMGEQELEPHDGSGVQPNLKRQKVAHESSEDFGDDGWDERMSQQASVLLTQMNDMNKKMEKEMHELVQNLMTSSLKVELPKVLNKLVAKEIGDKCVSDVVQKYIHEVAQQVDVSLRPFITSAIKESVEKTIKESVEKTVKQTLEKTVNKAATDAVNRYNEQEVMPVALCARILVLYCSCRQRNRV